MPCPLWRSKHDHHASNHASARALPEQVVKTDYSHPYCLLRSGEDEGTVTAEFAVVFPVVIAVALLVLCLVRTVIVQVSCHDAAREAARIAVLAQHDGLPISQIREKAAHAVIQVAGNDSRVVMNAEDDYFDITVTCPIAGSLSTVIPMSVQGHARGVRDTYE